MGCDQGATTRKSGSGAAASGFSSGRATMTNIELFTDGACSGNPGPGGWAAILRSGGHERELSGGKAHTTNNQMELMAVIEGLRAIKAPAHVALYNDHKHVM